MENSDSRSNLVARVHQGDFLPTTPMSKCPMWFHLTNCCIQIFLGTLGFVTFGFFFHNVHAGVWSLFSGVFALGTLNLHLLHQNRTMERCCSVQGLNITYYLGIIGIIVGMSAGTAYLVIAMVNHIPVLPVETSFVIACVQAFLTAKWAFFMTMVTNAYRKILIQGYDSANDMQQQQA